MNDNFYESILNNIHDGIYFVDNEKRITYWNKGAERITGYKKEEVLGSKCSDNILRHIDINGKELCVIGCPLGQTLSDGNIRNMDIFLHHKNGHRVPVSVRISSITNDNNEIIGAVELFSDNSVRMDIIREMESLKREVFIDQLTGVSNRKYGDMNLNNRFEEFRTYKIPFGILFIDIDYFKNLNDTYGHYEGDKVLIMVSKTISNLLRKLDVISRWGGEEFIVILSNINETSMNKIAERMRIFVEKSWITINNENLSVTVSIGGTIAREQDTIESLIKRADTLMYNSKRTGRNRITIG